ncbi:hypothetical protein GQ44DRAFT_395440 [Phaeosphaeriaceae sp. PMI808]|nr:hypothetical protein GQ44DRAFT_395440 [Phaeosphaeriaceae sp. PMI808]
MSLKLFIPPCIHEPPHQNHPPPRYKPLRIEIQGPLETIQKLRPDVAWHPLKPFPQPAGRTLASLAHQTLYGEDDVCSPKGDLPIRHEYLAWAMEGRRPLDYIDYYGVTFDYLVPADDTNPEVLVISIIEVDNDGGEFANKHLSFLVDPTEYTGKKVLAVPRCCQVKKGTKDRWRISSLVAERDEIRGQQHTQPL